MYLLITHNNLTNVTDLVLLFLMHSFKYLSNYNCSQAHNITKTKMHVFFTFFFFLSCMYNFTSLHFKSYSFNHVGILRTLLLFLRLNVTGACKFSFYVVTGAVKRASVDTFHFFLSLRTKVLFPICCSMFSGGEN